MEQLDTDILKIKTSIENKSAVLKDLEENTNKAYQKAIE